MILYGFIQYKWGFGDILDDQQLTNDDQVDFTDDQVGSPKHGLPKVPRNRLLKQTRYG